MLAEPGFWLIVAGSVLVAASLIGLAFSSLSQEVPSRQDEPKPAQSASDGPIDLPKWFSTDKKPFGRAVPKRTASGDHPLKDKRRELRRDQSPELEIAYPYRRSRHK
jgi:hypothetical protein